MIRLDFPRTLDWFDACDTYRSELKLSSRSDLAIQVFTSTVAALNEICIQLGQMYSHRKGIAFFKGQNPHFESLGVALSRLEYNIHPFEFADLATPSAWLDAHQKDTLLIIAASDDPSTGRIFDLAPLRAALQGKKIFLLTTTSRPINSAANLSVDFPGTATNDLTTDPGTNSTTKFEPSEILLATLASGRALSVAGDRARIKPIVAKHESWAGLTPAEIARDLSAPSERDLTSWQTSIEALESNLPQGLAALLPKGTHRVFDRSVVYSESLDGLSLATELAQELKTALGAPATETMLDTLSLCRWRDPKATHYLVEQGFDAKKLRGSLILSGELIAKTPGIKVSFEKAVARVKELSGY